ncbi:MAG: HAD family hydrolase [Planctomycetota bacterium]|nr:MAG: HAD family hydrolase [Planctomycetota bacterium]
MAKSLAEYLDSLDSRSDLIFPKPPRRQPIKATPTCKALPEIQVVIWSLYGTLLSIDSGRLQHDHPQEFRMQIALQKTIDEFKMWNSMSRKPGQPWEYMLQQYRGVLEEMRMAGTRRKGDVPELDSTAIWGKLIDRLMRNEFEWDRGTLGDEESLAVKVAYFFHAMLQGTTAFDGTAETLARIGQAGLRQGLLDDMQQFSLAQLLQELRRQGAEGHLTTLFSPELSGMSYQLGIRKPSPTLFETVAARCGEAGFAPQQVFYLTNRLTDDLSEARQVGFRTGLMVVDASCTRIDANDLKNPNFRPDRLLTDVRQVCDIVGA